MTRAELRITIKVAWWLKFYMFGVILMSRITGMSPDESKVRHYIMRGISVKASRK